MATYKTTVPITAIYKVSGPTGPTKTQGTYQSVLSGNGTDFDHVVLVASFNTFAFNPSPDEVTNVDIELWYNESELNSPIEEIEIVKLTLDPATASASDLYNAISNASGNDIYASTKIRGVNKTKTVINLGSSVDDEVCQIFTTRTLASPYEFRIGIRRISSLIETGTVSIGGPDLLFGIAENWESSSVLKSPAKFIVTYDTDSSRSALHLMKYTTSDPTDISGQQSPQNSIGGYIATNSVFVIGENKESFSSTQEYIQLENSSNLPDQDSGLLLIGSEIVKFSSFDSDTKTITISSRPISPERSFPAPASFTDLSLFREPVRYLNVSKIFNTKPISGSDQYRCIAIQREPIGVGISSIKLYLIQSENNNVQIDIGIEVPSFDCRPTPTIDAPGIPSGRSFFSSSSSVVDGLSDGYFIGAHVIVDPNGSSNGPSHAIVENFTISGSTAEFTLDTTIPAFSGGTLFRVNPAPCQRTSNDIEKPLSNNGLFLGFFAEGGTDIVTLTEHEEMTDYDAFYIWIKRTLSNNTKKTDDSGAIIVMSFDNTNEEES